MSKVTFPGRFTRLVDKLMDAEDQLSQSNGILRVNEENENCCKFYRITGDSGVSQLVQNSQSYCQIMVEAYLCAGAAWLR